ncbi:MAG: hypothetical protein M1825_006130 [Sarcosagium campestre]|nr:MAG: hypothetical protein M1825_006130 [Sarcosagium campestre]
MDFQLLPSTVYQPSTPGLVRENKLNTIMEEGHNQQRSFAEPLKSPPSAGFGQNGARYIVSPMSDDFPTPRAQDFIARAPSPSSSVDSSSLSWTSSESGRTRSSGTDFDDLYDQSDDEVDKDGDTVPLVLIRRPRSYAISESQSRDSSCSNSAAERSRLPSLVIPSPSQWPGPPGWAKNSAVPPTPPPKIPISPAVLSLLTRDCPASVNLPSLDGSLSSDQLAASTAPPTPSIGSCEEEGQSWDSGVQLNPEALATLQFLSGDEHEAQIESAIEVSRAEEMREAPPVVRQSSDETITPATQRCLSSLTQLDIPSPGGFFSSLAPASRHTWCPPSANPPSSTTAENFYGCPWNKPQDNVLEQIVEVAGTNTDGPPTALMDTPRAPKPEQSLTDETDAAEEVQEVDYDVHYEENLKETASTNLSRTSLWLSAQEDYMTTLREAIDPSSAAEPDIAAVASPGKKSVSFSQEIKVELEPVESPVEKKESVYLRGLQFVLAESQPKDAFVHSETRFDALQTERVCAAVAHRDQLLGKYSVTAKRGASDEDKTEAAKHTERAQKERKALDQMSHSTWNVMATKMLNGGKLLNSPATRDLARSTRLETNVLNRTRVLDLGGQAVCDWAWHCAEEFPNAKVYTVVTKGQRQSSSLNMRGPQNHRQIAVPCLWKLPFPDRYFDVVSARSIYSLLTVDRPVEGGEDQYDLCLKECLRCLKPGGYLEFSLLDSDIMNAGPMGSAMSVEFGFNLKTRGYDPTPTRGWVARLNKAGFASVKRSWLVLPMGAPSSKRDISGIAKTSEEGELIGSTVGAANITGLVGSWAWEQWMLKLQMESGKNQDKLLEGVSGVIEEGRNCGAAWRCLTGWARKPFDL